ncbi:MAG: tetratricopeptide repeat protein, partial [Myxococcales bacterium]|nr:tetratricopeptide repeat protein [Myxococcales bacterium]
RGENGEVKVLDFGLAIRTDNYEDSTASPTSSSTRLTQTGALVGTPAYMAPEQHIGVGIDERSDQFSFCVALFEALYRKHPFPHRDFMELSMSVMTGKHAAVPSSSDVPVQLRKAVLRGLSPEPASRHPSMQALLDALLDDPARRRRRLLIGAAAGLGVLALVAGVTASLANTGSRCAGAERHLAGAWGEERREAIERAFLDTDLPYAPKTWETTDEVLDGYARDWTRMRTEACEATHVHGEQSNELLDRRMACLDVQLQRFAALSDLLVEADERVVLNAVEAAESLPPLSECADTRRLMHRPEPPSPAEQAAIDGLEADLARCATLTLAGRYDQAVALARDVEERAEAGGFSRLAANATFRRGAAEESAGKYADAVEHLARAAQLAERVGDDNLRVRIVNNLGIVLGTKLHHLEEAARVLRHAEAILDRIDAHALLRAQVQRSLGLVLSGRGEHEQAIAELRASIDALRASGARETLTASALLSLGVALDRGGAPEEALAVYQEALAIYERRLGDQHPTVASLLNNIAVVHKSRGELDLALAAFQRSLEIRRHALRGDHPAIGQSLENLANVYESMGETEKAIASSEAALAHYRRVLGDDDWRIAGALYNLGVIHHTSGDHERALECYREALARTERIHGRDDPEVAYPLTGLGSVLVELGRMEEAVEPLERALELRTRPGAVPIDLGEIRFALARALLSTRARDEDPRAQAAARARARSLAEASLDDYQASGDERTTARIRRWIARELEGDDASRAP